MGGGINSSSLKELPTNINTIINGKKKIAVLNNINTTLTSYTTSDIPEINTKAEIKLNIIFDPSIFIINLKASRLDYSTWYYCDISINSLMENDIDIANVSGNIKISPKNIKYDKRQKKIINICTI